MTFLRLDDTAAGKLHHFIVGFEVFHDMKQVLEDVEAALGTVL